ncbi:MAG: hypothetical protein WD557_20310 [Dehalococcoidia bacterium]
MLIYLREVRFSRTAMSQPIKPMSGIDRQVDESQALRHYQRAQGLKYRYVPDPIDYESATGAPTRGGKNTPRELERSQVTN